ncbi:MAG TPA: PAS domain S-box protein [Burkholderiales bacterium]|nr:PAS domain S-box protein [Burkholderiales bacterium]
MAASVEHLDDLVRLEHGEFTAEQLGLLQREIGIATWVWDVTEGAAKWYGDPSALLGFSPGDFSGRFEECLQHVHPEDCGRARETLVACLKGLKPEFRTEGRVIWPNGSVHWLACYGRGFYGPDGRARRLAGVIREISDSERTERLLRIAREKFEAIFAAIPEAVAITRKGDSTVVEVNDAWVAFTGYPREAILGRTVTSLGLYEVAEHRDHVVQCMDKGQPVFNYQTRFIRSDGKALDIRLSAVRVEIGGEWFEVWSWSDMTEQKRAEQLARQSLQKFEALFETSPEAIVVTRPRDHTIVDINGAALRLIGITREEAKRAARPREVMSWLDQAGLDRFHERLIRGERLVGEFQAFKRPDGKIVEALWSASRVDVDGETYFVISMRDMSDVRRIERAGAESERRYRTLFVEAPDGIIILSPEGTILSINPAACRATGYQVEEILGEPIGRLLSASSSDRLSAGAGEILSGSVKRADLEAQRKDGSLFPVEVVVERLPNGNTLTFVRDISERKRQEQMLMSLARGVSAEVGETFFQSLVSHVGRALQADYVLIGELMPTPRGRVRSLAFWNQGGPAPNFEYALEGTPCADALKRPSTLTFPHRVCAVFPDDKELRELQVEGYVGTSLFDSRGNVLGILVAMSRKAITHPSLWASVLEIFAARAAAEIERSRAEAQVRELNVSLERRVAERTRELEAANRELDAFSYSVSHDLRAPLHAITGFAEIVRVAHGQSLPAKALHYFERIEHNARQMDNLIGELLEFSRAWRMPLNRASVDMRELVEEVLQGLRPEEVRRARIEIGELPPARGDRSLLRQVWSNLIGNALKFSRGAFPPQIQIGGEQRGDEIEYFVKDNGAGFDQRYADKLFGVFQRLHSSSEFEGSGVGLALVQRIVARHGGRVAAEGAPGRGATFRFVLPLPPAEA